MLQICLVMTTAREIAHTRQDSGPKPKRQPRLLTLEEFRKRYADREDGFKYEFKNGEVIKSPGQMNPSQLYIVKNLNRRFARTKAYEQGGELIAEVDQMTAPAKQRRPDLSYWSAARIANGQESVSEFVLEIISPTDRLEDVEEKLLEYFEAGVKVVWQIRPRSQSVHVYTAPTEVSICTGDTVCSAAPVLPDFRMKAREVFERQGGGAA